MKKWFRVTHAFFSLKKRPSFIKRKGTTLYTKRESPTKARDDGSSFHRTKIRREQPTKRTDDDEDEDLRDVERGRTGTRTLLEKASSLFFFKVSSSSSGREEEKGRRRR